MVMSNDFLKSLGLLLCVFIGMSVFSLIPNSFVNYGHDYLQYIDVSFSAALLLILLVLFGWADKVNIPRTSLVFVPFVCLLVFWVFRTRIHVFGGDGAVGTLPVNPLTLLDFIPRGPRLDGFGSGLLFHLLNQTPLFEKIPILPSILNAQIYTIVVGFAFAVVICWCFRLKPLIACFTLTLPTVFNFFGNIDSYALSICYEALFLAFLIHMFHTGMAFPKLLILGVLWGIGLWMHPFHVFDGFVVVWFGARWLRGKWEKCPPTCLFLVLYFAILFTVIKCSGHANHLFVENDLVPPSFSLDTFSHWLNQIALPLLPVYILLLWNKCRSSLLLIPVLGSFVFFILRFTLGAADQFCYAHLMFVLSVPLILCLTEMEVARLQMLLVIFINLFTLIPMIAVHCGDLTIKRAQRLYPIDICRHNRVMSWQTHLTLVLGDNLQPNPKIRQALLATAYHGAQYAQPEGFRGGNYCYYVAWHYHFGLFGQGERLLADLLRKSPHAVRMFLGERPAFTYLNRERLWQDVEKYFPARNESEGKAIKDAIQAARVHATKNPYMK